MRADPTGTRKPVGAVYASCHYFSPLFMLCLNDFTFARPTNCLFSRESIL